MSRRNNINSRYPERGESSSGKYSTLTKRRNSQSAHNNNKKSKRIGLIVTIVGIVVLLGASLYVFFGWEQIKSMATSGSVQLVDTPTPMPTSIPTPTPTPNPSETPEATVSPSPIPSSTPRPDKVNITISLVGDLTFYQTQLDDAYDEETDTYDFSHNFEPVKEYIESANIAIGNMNTTLAGKELGYSGDPSSFNTPESVLDAIKGVGFDVLLTANPNVFAQGWVGVLQTNNFIKKAGIKTTGTYLSEKEYYKPLIVETEGVKVAILNYADSTTIEKAVDAISEDQLTYAVKKLKLTSVRRDVQACKEADADIIIAYVNWGDEYSQTPSEYMRSAAQSMLEVGVDAIFGTYPQVLQYVTRKGVEQEYGGYVDAVVAYSLGSFITSQRTQYLDSGAIFNITYEHDATDDSIALVDISYVPTWVSMADTDTADKNYQVIPVGKYLDDSELYGTLSSTSQARIVNVWSETTNMLGENVARAVR